VREVEGMELDVLGVLSEILAMVGAICKAMSG